MGFIASSVKMRLGLQQLLGAKPCLEGFHGRFAEARRDNLFQKEV